MGTYKKIYFYLDEAMAMKESDYKALLDILFPQPKQEKYFFTYRKEDLKHNNQLKELITKFCNKYYNDCNFVDITVIDENVIKIHDYYWSQNDMQLVLQHDIPKRILFDYYDYMLENYDNNEVKQYSNVLDYFNNFK